MRNTNTLRPLTKIIIVLLLCLGIPILAWYSLDFFAFGMKPRFLGTGGYVLQVAQDMPHPFSFERPRLWYDRTAELRQNGENLEVLVLGPPDEAQIRLTTIAINVEPTVSQGGKFVTIDEFAAKRLPLETAQKRVNLGEGQVQVAGRQARSILFVYDFLTGPPHTTLKSVASRGTAVFFEDRGYFYMLEYSTVEVDYDGYFEVFDHAVKSFRFLD